MGNKQKGNLRISENTVVHCKTEKLAKEVLQIAHNLGYTWIMTKSFSSHTNFSCCEDDTCYDLHGGHFCSKGYYKRKGFNIISAKKFLKLHNGKKR